MTYTDRDGGRGIKGKDTDRYSSFNMHDVCYIIVLFYNSKQM